MKTRIRLATLALAALGTQLLADIPDGHGGRTSPQASPRRVEAPPHACCPPRQVFSATAARPAVPAERKTVGEVVWGSRHMTVVSETVPCFKMTRPEVQTYSSPAELKAIGHVRRTAQAKRNNVHCCGAAFCPMRNAS
jgi:hypothetical protein